MNPPVPASTATALAPSTESSRRLLVARIAMGAALIVGALVFAGWTGEQVEARFPVGRIVRLGLQGLIMSAIVVPGVWWLRTRFDRLPMRGLGLGPFRPSLAAFGLGAMIILVPLILTVGTTVAFGWATVTVDRSSARLLALLAGIVTAFLFEALPEELVVRGYLYRTLNAVAPRWAAAGLTVFLFILLPLGATLIGTVVLGMPVSVGGNSMITASYVITMAIFGAFTVYLRVLTGTIWTSIGFHLTFLMFNRAVGPRPTAVVRFTDVTAGGPLQMVALGSAVVIVIGLLAYPRLSGRSLGWGLRDPE